MTEKTKFWVLLGLLALSIALLVYLSTQSADVLLG